MHVALRSYRKEKEKKRNMLLDPDLLLEVQEVVGLVDEKDLQSRAPEVVPAQVNLSDLRQRPFKVLTHTWKHRASVSSLSSFTLLDIALYQLLLTFLFLCAAVVEVDVLSGELQTTRININHRDQLTVLWDHQLLLLTRLFRISPNRTTARVFTCTTFLKKLILSFSEDAFNWSKVAFKRFINVTKK